MITKTKSIYFFGNKTADGDASLRNTIGGKGANLAVMTGMGIPVPPGFTISTEECTEFYQNNQRLSDELLAEVDDNLAKVESVMGASFGDAANPLLFSVRSGARVSMPGMMDTILNLGLNDQAVEGLAQKSNSPRFAWDSYRRFIQMFSSVVLGVDHGAFEKRLEARKDARGIELDTELTVEDLKGLVDDYKALLAEHNTNFPQDPKEQLKMSIAAVFKSWDTERARKYRRINRIPDEWGTAVNVQTMVFGNLGEDSGTGVAFTRNPSTGENIFYGEYLINAQGEDVVAGIRTPQPIATLEAAMPSVYGELVDIYKKLESHFGDMQDLEFTIQEGKLYLLQTRNGKRTAAAAVKIAYDLYKEGAINKEEAVMRLDPEQLDQLLHPMIDPNAAQVVLAKGLPASPGAAVGKIIFTADEAEEQGHQGEAVILVREETSPEDIGGMHAAKGILTARGGMTSHAAVVARGMGTCCIAGCSDVHINEEEKYLTVNGKRFNQGDFITLNGSSGEVIEGKVDTVEPELSGEFGELMSWADEIRTMKIRTNADTPEDSQVARDFGAEGIGLCRTEHMFFDPERLIAVREMILASNQDARESALRKIEPFQQQDFEGIFEAMNGLPVTIRLLDPPLHEFLPHDDETKAALAKELNVDVEDVRKKVAMLKEVNPMLGHRGCRLGISYPEIYDMQTRAIIAAAIKQSKNGIQVMPEIMIPLVGERLELAQLKERVKRIADAMINEAGVPVNYMVGTMIEIPRAALMAAEVAKEAEFFSFGTNDLTQMTYGISRDDAGTFLPSYVEKGLYKEDPFQVLDQAGVGQLIQHAVDKGRGEKATLKIGICGEHGGEPSSVMFCHDQGFDYVSCSPYRVPIARLAAAQAVLRNK